MAHKEEKSDNAKVESLADVVDKLKDKADSEQDGVSVQEALDAFEGRVFGPLLLVPGLAVVTPLGAIPTVPTIMGVLIILIAAQLLFGRRNPWLPKVLADRSVEQQKFQKALQRFRPWANWLDRFTAPRMQMFVSGPMKYGVAAICILLGLTMPPLEFVPFACAAPGAAILMLGLAVTTKDGLIGLIGIVASLGAIGLAVWWLVF